MKILKPPRLRKGDVIGLIAPASAPSSQEKVEGGVKYLESLGYRVKVGKHVLKINGYLAGTDEQRLTDLNAMVRDDAVKAIIAIRGGYGTPRLLGQIDYRAVQRSPKIVVGYSDLTALQLALFRRVGLVTFSGPMSGVEMWNSIDPYTEEHFWRVVTSKTKVGKLENPESEPLSVLKEGRASGRILGGNLSLLQSLMGTRFMPDLRDSILVLEDVDEAPHRVDRMFAQLRNAGILKNIAGLILGKFTDCVPSDATKPHLTIDQVIADAVSWIQCPALSNFQYGHIPQKLTIPLGLKARLDSRNKSMEIMEGAVV
ncbi:MAG: LD-carboxypeptidase [Bacteroidota bacterium]